MTERAKAKSYPLPKRFSAALSEAAYRRLRGLNERYGFGNNYLLTILLERLDDIADADALDRIYADFAAGYGTPAPSRGPPRTRGAVKTEKTAP